MTRLCFFQIFVGGLDSDVSDDDLRQPFSQFGEIISVKIPPGKGCGFVQFVNRCLPICTSPHYTLHNVESVVTILLKNVI